MRDLLPLPGVTPAQVVSQLAHRVFGPLQPARTKIVLDYHGLLANRAETLTGIADRHRVTGRTVANNAAAVRAVGARQPLAPLLVIEAERDSTPEDDHLGRVRIATTLGLTQPEPPPVDPPPIDDRTLSSSRTAVARTGQRLLTALGPSLTLPEIASAVARSRRFRDRKPLFNADLAAALRAVGCTVDDHGRWHPPVGAVPSDRDRAIVTLAAGRDLTRAEMIGILLAAGYRESSAAGRMSSSHPLFRRVGPDRYRLVGDHDLPGRVGQLGQVSG